jgi:hypothetical protein
MKKPSKPHTKALEVADLGNGYSVLEAIELLKNMPQAKLDQNRCIVCPFGSRSKAK